MERLERDLAQVFADVAMAEEGGDFSALVLDIYDAAGTFECSFVDVTFAEVGEFSETVCVPHLH
ncbi:MAG: hypothetical protein HY885_00515 [Deltaproteobacteria bacterium]|nr:hypothetical protein [Deltaproteobacteria bacterium]